LTKGRIATRGSMGSHECARLSLHTPLQGLPMLFNRAGNPQNCPFPWKIMITSNTWFLGSTSVRPLPQQHIDRFSRLVGLTNVTIRQTYTQTHKQTTLLSL